MWERERGRKVRRKERERGGEAECVHVRVRVIECENCINLGGLHNSKSRLMSFDFEADF